MAVLLSEVGRRGRMELVFGTRNDQTVLRDSYCEVPFKITRLLQPNAPGIAHLILMQSTAGLFGGDVLECTVHVESGARVLITQQSATKVHPSAGLTAMQRTKISVEEGGELQIYYEPLIPFAGSRVQTAVSIEIGPSARLCYWEGLMAGRIGKGESWQFEELSSETSIRIAGELGYLDRYRLGSSADDPRKEWVMNRCAYLGTGIRFGEPTPDFARRLHDVLPEAGVDSPIPGLTVARIVASTGPEFYRSRTQFLRTCSMV